MSAGWTTATSRADAVARKDGVFVKSSDPTRRLVGTVLTDTHGTFLDTFVARFVWNADNRVDRDLAPLGVDGWLELRRTAWRAANNSTGNAISYVDGAVRTCVSHRLGLSKSSDASPRAGYAGIGVRLEHVDLSAASCTDASPSTVAALQCRAYYNGYPGIGQHTLYWIERSHNGLINVSFFGSPGFEYQLGISGRVKA